MFMVKFIMKLMQLVDNLIFLINANCLYNKGINKYENYLKHLLQEKAMSKKGFSLAEVMFASAVVVIVAAIAIPNLLRSRITANETGASATLKTIATALESYAGYSGQGYPVNFADLVGAFPPYINENYVANSPIRGYVYACPTLGVGGYSCTATPDSCGTTGSKVFTITTGGALSDVDCT